MSGENNPVEHPTPAQPNCAPQPGSAKGGCGCNDLCAQRGLASDEVNGTCRAVHRGSPVATSDLRERCAEILHWRKTGVLNGDALRSYAETKHYAQKDDVLQMAESDTVREAFAVIVASAAVQPAALLYADTEAGEMNYCRFNVPLPYGSKLYSMPPASPDAALVEALEYYANGDHLLLADPDAWDTCSGEPMNFLHDAAGTASVEDGSVAKQALERYRAARAQGEVQ